MPRRGEDSVWCIVMFDLPVSTKSQRAQASNFRHFLMDEGFCMLQFSVYVQYLPVSVRLHKIIKHIKDNLPHGGDVRVLNVSDTQWAKALRFSSKKPAPVEKEPEQLTIF